MTAGSDAPGRPCRSSVTSGAPDHATSSTSSSECWASHVRACSPASTAGPIGAATGPVASSRERQVGRSVVGRWRVTTPKPTARRVEAVGFGVVTLQRPTTERPTWRSRDEATGPVAAPMGPAVDAGLQARTWLAQHSDDDVLDVAWSGAPDVTEERHGRPGAEDPSVILVRQGGGLGRVVRAGALLAAYLGVADGELTARAALDAIATVLGLDAADVRSELVPQVRDLVADGLLT